MALTTASLLLITSAWPTSARIQDGSVRFVASSVFGMALEQTTRICIGTTTPRGPALDWSVRLSDERGALLFQLLEQHSPAGEWRCGDIPRSMLAVAGDAGTGRVQVAMEILVKAPPDTKSSDIIGSAELISATGATEAYQVVNLSDVLVTSVQHANPR